MTRRGIHTKPNNGKTVEWLTPPEILEALGPFDLDPCAHPEQPWKTAEKMISPPDDGLKIKWRKYGTFFLNPPYGTHTKVWLKKACIEASHGASGISLVPARTEVESWFWPYIWQRADAILFLKGRLYFKKPDGTTAGNAGHGSVLVAYGEPCVEKLLNSGIEGALVYPEKVDFIK